MSSMRKFRSAGAAATVAPFISIPVAYAYDATVSISVNYVEAEAFANALELSYLCSEFDSFSAMAIAVTGEEQDGGTQISQYCDPTPGDLYAHAEASGSDPHGCAWIMGVYDNQAYELDSEGCAGSS